MEFMEEPFDMTISGIHYAVFPEEDGIYTIFKEGKEYMKIQKDAEDRWLKLDPESELPLFTENPEVDQIGRTIAGKKS